jgi:hypothetical protein
VRGAQHWTRALLHDDQVVADISVRVSGAPSQWHGATHEKMTFLGRRFLEKGRRSGSCFDVHVSIAHYHIRRPAASEQCPVQLQCFWAACAGGEGSRRGWPGVWRDINGPQLSNSPGATRTSRRETKKAAAGRDTRRYTEKRASAADRAGSQRPETGSVRTLQVRAAWRVLFSAWLRRGADDLVLGRLASPAWGCCSIAPASSRQQNERSPGAPRRASGALPSSRCAVM